MSDSPPNKLNYHKSILSVLARLRTYSRIKKHLKQLGCSRSEQREIIRALKKECEIIWREFLLPYIIAMTTLIDLSPYWNEYSNEWEVSESDERGNTLEVYGFNTEDDALNFINEWIEKNNLTPA